MFKNLIVYRIASGWSMDITQVEEALAKTPFLECGATQAKSSGWVPPRGEENGALAESRFDELDGVRFLRDFLADTARYVAEIDRE